MVIRVGQRVIAAWFAQDSPEFASAFQHVLFVSDNMSQFEMIN